MTLREKLIVLRDKAGISQMSLAHQLDVSRQAVSRWESGDTTPSMDKLKALAKIYGVSLDWLCSDVADEKPFEVAEPSEDNETNNANVQFRSTPSTSGSVYATIFDGESFPRRFNSGNWVCGVYATNTGYSHGDYVDGELRAD